MAPETSDITDNRLILGSLIGTLVRYGPSGLTEPALAENWEVSNDHLRWEFNLRPNLKCDDGEIIDAPTFVKHLKSALVRYAKSSKLMHFLGFLDLKMHRSPELDLIRARFSWKMAHMYRRILQSRCEKVLVHKSLLLLGPRQVGKSTLIKTLKPNLLINLASQREYLNHLKDPGLLERMVAAQSKKALIYIDEIQRIPALLNTIQSIVDSSAQVRFALTGSSARKLNRGQANLLPGRILFEKLFPITYWELEETGDSEFIEQLLVKGSLPEIINSEIADDLLDSYVDIYLKEEIQAEALTKDLGDYGRFLNLAAEVSGQFLNYSKLASDAEISKDKVRRYFAILEDTLLIHRIENYGELSPQRKARQKDRFVFFDNGVRNAILRKTRNQMTQTELGPLFEQWILQQIIAWNQYQKKNWRITTYRDDRNLEVDIIIETTSKTYLIEVKYQRKYRKEFVAALGEFMALKKGKNLVPIVVYIGTEVQKGPNHEQILPLKQFMKLIAEIN